MGGSTHIGATARTPQAVAARLVPPLVAVLALVAVSLSGAASADHSGYRAYTGPATVTGHEGNATCLELEDEAVGELKVEPFDESLDGDGSGTVHSSDDGRLSVRILEVEQGEDGAFFDFEVTDDSQVDVSSVFVKQASGGLLYDYGATPSSGDQNLHPQTNPNTGTVFSSISHVSFCYQTEPEPTPVIHRVDVNPDHDTNQVATEHTFTVRVESSRDDGASWEPVEGALIDADDYAYAVHAADRSGMDPGALTVLDDDCAEAGTDAHGECDIVVTAAASGATKLTVRSALLPDGSTVVTFRGPVSDVVSFKHWVDYEVDLDVDSVNLLGQEHTFTVTARRDDGFGELTPLGGAVLSLEWSGPEGSTIDWTGDGTADGGSSASGTCTTDTDGTCTATVDSDSEPGTGTLTVTGLVAPAGDVTDGGTLDLDGRAMDKTWLAFEVVLTPPEALNPTGTDHVFDIHVVAYDGDGDSELPEGLAGHLQGDAADAELYGGDEHLSLDPQWTSDVGTLQAHDCDDLDDGHCAATVFSADAGEGTLSVEEITTDHDGDGSPGAVTSAEGVVPGVLTGDQATKTWEVPASPSISLDKTGSTTFAGEGDTVTYTYTITNTGNVPLSDVTLEDAVTVDDTTTLLALLGPADGVTLAPGESTTITPEAAAHTVTTADLPGPLDNTATAAGAAPDGTRVSDRDSWSVSLEPVVAVLPGTPVTRSGDTGPVDRPDREPEPDVTVEPASDRVDRSGADRDEAARGGALPRTGAGSASLLLIALTLLSGGGAALWAGRREHGPAGPTR